MHPPFLVLRSERATKTAVMVGTVAMRALEMQPVRARLERGGNVGTVFRGTRLAVLSEMETKPRMVVLAGVDADRSAAEVIATAARLAAIDQGELHLVHVLEQPDPKHLTAQLEGARLLVERTAGSATQMPYTTHIAAGPVPQQLLQIATNIEADLIVLGTRELSIVERALIGSIVANVVRRASCPVHVVRKKNYGARQPEVEPPCAACLEVQRTTRGAELWCARHKTKHVHGRLHFELPERFAVGTTFLRPEES